LKWLKAGNSLAIEKALSHLQLEVKEISSMKTAKISDLFKDKATIKGLIITLALFSGQQFSGIFALVTKYLQAPRILRVKLLSHYRF